MGRRLDAALPGLPSPVLGRRGTGPRTAPGGGHLSDRGDRVGSAAAAAVARRRPTEPGPARRTGGRRPGWGYAGALAAAAPVLALPGAAVRGQPFLRRRVPPH